MTPCQKSSETALVALELQDELEDLEGLLRADLKAVVAMITQRAHERLLLGRSERKQLQATLWNNLVGAIHRSVDPLRVENR